MEAVGQAASVPLFGRTCSRSRRPRGARPPSSTARSAHAVLLDALSASSRPPRAGPVAPRRRRPPVGRPVHPRAGRPDRDLAGARRARSWSRPGTSSRPRGPSAQHVAHRPPVTGRARASWPSASPKGAGSRRSELDRAIERSDGIPFFLEELLRSSARRPGPGGRPGPRSDIPACAARPPPGPVRSSRRGPPRRPAPGHDRRRGHRPADRGDRRVPLSTRGRAAPAADGRRRHPRARGAGEPPTYRFRHHLLGDLAYDTQLRPARERAHGAVADALRSGASVGVAAAPAVWPTTSSGPAGRGGGRGASSTPPRRPHPRRQRRGRQLVGAGPRAGARPLQPSARRTSSSRCGSSAPPACRRPSGSRRRRRSPTTRRAGRSPRGSASTGYIDELPADGADLGGRMTWCPR